MALLGDGQLRLGQGSGPNFTVSGGFMQVLNDNVRVVTEKATATR
jgi:F0F1-type ATP synthase epsilon subunit